MFVITLMLLICLGVFGLTLVTAIEDIRAFDKRIEETRHEPTYD